MHAGVQDIGSIDIKHSEVYTVSAISPVLCFRLSVLAFNEQFGLGDVKAELQLSNNGMSIGKLISHQPFMRIYPGSEHPLDLFLELDHYKLSQIEKFRKGGDLALRMNIRFILEKWGRPQDRNVGYLDNLSIEIPKSTWVEKILPNLGFKDISLIELPKISQEWQNIIEHLNEAWRQHSMGKYDNVLTECRKTLETLSEEVKKRGFKKKETSLPDWEQLLGSKDLDDIFGTINQKLHGFLAPGAHAGKAINREDADFALLVTQGIVAIATEKLMKIPK